MSGPTVEQVLEANGIEDDFDVFQLSRQLGRLPRCHTLSVSRHQSVAEHTLNCLMLLDFVESRGLISPGLGTISMKNIKTALQFHDFREACCGDVPFPVSRHMVPFETEMHNLLMKSFSSADVKLMEIEQQVVNQIDMLEFAIYMKEELDGIEELSCTTLSKKRLFKAYHNSLDALASLYEKSTFKIDYKFFLYFNYEFSKDPGEQI